MRFFEIRESCVIKVRKTVRGTLAKAAEAPAKNKFSNGTRRAIIDLYTSLRFDADLFKRRRANIQHV